jgi:hypothetical protein
MHRWTCRRRELLRFEAILIVPLVFDVFIGVPGLSICDASIERSQRL